MSEIRELSFCELRRKDIVSINDGRKLGKIIDLVFSPSGKVKGIVAPYGKKFLIFQSQEVYIPYSNIKTIGEDIILVDIDTGLNRRPQHQYEGIAEHPSEYKYSDGAESKAKYDYDEHKQNEGCDGRCDKCMLFDCESRWKKQNNARNTVYVDNSPYK